MNKKHKWTLGLGALLLPFVIIFILFLMVNCARVPQGLPPNIVLDPAQVNSDLRGKRSTVTVIATDYYRAGPITKLVQGKNYRNAWAAPIEVELLWLDTLRGGVRVLEAGGGGQTQSLDLMDSMGNIYALRSVTKNPSPSVPGILHTLKLEDIIYDAMSAGHPYGAMPVARLSDAAGILHTRPRLVYVPKQEVLGEYSEEFGNRLYLFEYEGEDENARWTGLEGVEAIIDSDDLAEITIEEEGHHARQKELLYARMLDLVVGDWDRHAGQWGWAKVPTDSGTWYHPVATDRDNAFYKIGGIAPFIITHPLLGSKFRPFRKKIRSMEGMMTNGMALNTFFLNRMEETDYLEAARKLQLRLTDETVEEAIRTWPDTIYALDGPEIIEKIKARRDDLEKYAREFYSLMARAPEIHGSIGSDHFKIESYEDGSLLVSVSAPDRDGGEDHLLYRRKFNPEETSEVRLFSWEGDDVFLLEGEGSPIAIKISGGDGTNEIRYMTSKKELVSWELKLKQREDWKKLPEEVRVYETSFKPMMPE